MALSLSPPCGLPSDEEEEMAVFESTAAEHGGLSRPGLPEISVISPGLDTRPLRAGPVRAGGCILGVNVSVVYCVKAPL